MDLLHYLLETAKTNSDKLLAILEIRIQFEQIHAFLDGNGRTVRMVMMYSLLQEGLPPLIIEKEAKAQYIEFLANKVVEEFYQFTKEGL